MKKIVNLVITCLLLLSSFPVLSHWSNKSISKQQTARLSYENSGNIVKHRIASAFTNPSSAPGESKNLAFAFRIAIVAREDKAIQKANPTYIPLEYYHGKDFQKAKFNISVTLEAKGLHANQPEAKPENASSKIPLEPLTPREKDVLVQVAHGKTNKEIAKKLKITPKTVEVYLYRITRKLRVPTRVGVAVCAVIYGLVDINYEELQSSSMELT